MMQEVSIEALTTTPTTTTHTCTHTQTYTHTHAYTRPEITESLQVRHSHGVLALICLRNAHSLRTRFAVIKQIFSSDAAVSEETMSKAQQEARLLSELKHPHIVQFYDQFVDGSCVNIVTEYCDGGDLSAAIDWQKDLGGGSPFGEPVVLSWLVQLTTALSYMHERRVLHRDVKTKNVFLLKSKGRRIVKLGP